MKKIRILLFSLFLVVFSAAAAAGAAKTGTYTVNRDVLYIYEEPDGLSRVCGEITRGYYVTLTEISGGYGKAFFASRGISGWVETAGLTPVPSEDAKTDITEIKVAPPDKTEYIHGEETLDLTGMTVTAVYKDGTEKTLSGYRVYADSFDTTGRKTVTVLYAPKGTNAVFTDSFTVTVVPLSISGIKVVSMPARTAYKEHELPDLSGLKITVEYTDRPSETFSYGKIISDEAFTVSKNAFLPLEPGETEITVGYKYEGIKTSFTLTAARKKLTSLRVLTQPESLKIYSKNSTPDITGLTLSAAYDNGETKTVQAYECEISCDTSGFILGGGNPVTVLYDGGSVTLYYTLALNEEKGIYVITPSVLTFRLGFDIDLSGLRVYREYADGTITPLNDYKLGSINKSITGSQNITVSAGQYSEVFSIYISPYYGKGDIDGNGRVDITDARLTLRAAIGFIRTGGMTLEASDIDKNGKVTVTDARSVLRAAIKLDDFVADSKVILP